MRDEAIVEDGEIAISPLDRPFELPVLEIDRVPANMRLAQARNGEATRKG